MEGEFRARKKAVQQLHDANSPKFAIFMRSPSGQSAKFKYLHDTIESAIERCRDFAFNAFNQGTTDFTYYAVEIKHKVGIERGKPVDEAIQ
jgi:hypothetical protein